MSALNDGGLLSPSDIADLAGVSRGAVSNWRKRDASFPKPAAGTTTKPLFAGSDVSVWLQAHARKAGSKVAASARESADMHVWSALNLLRDQLSAADAADLVLELAVSHRSGTRFDDRSVDVPTRLLEAVNHAVQRIEPSMLGPTIDSSLERLARSQGKQGGERGFIGSRTSSLLAGLAAAHPGGVHYDPACGIGTVLIESAQRGSRPARAVGHDISGSALQVAAHRAELYDFDIQLVQTDVLAGDADPSLRADVIVLEPPFGIELNAEDRLFDRRFEFGVPPRRSADTAWIQHAIAHLTTSGRAFVLTPTGTLARGGDEAKIRAELVKRGCIKAIVGLPGKLLPQTSIPLALWVLRHPVAEPTTESVLFIDASDIASPEDEVAGWLADARVRDEVPNALVPINDVLAAQADLAPERWVEQSEQAPDDISSTYVGGWKRIGAAMHELENLLVSFDHFATFSKSRVMTVAELIDQGVLDVRAGRPKDRYDDAPKEVRDRIATASDVRDGTFRDSGLDRPLDGYPELTQEGDVLVTTMHTIRARVDEAGGHIPSTGVYRLRVLNREVLSPDYLAVALGGNWNERFQAGATIRRASIKNLEVPLLPMRDQGSLKLAALSIRELSRSASRLADDANTVLAALLDAVRYNAPIDKTVPSVGDPGNDERNASEGSE